MNHKTIQQQVVDFWKRAGYGSIPEHSFAAWYLRQKYQINEADAMRQSSDGNYDYGIDGYCLRTQEQRPSLILIQAKYTDNLSTIAKGFQDLKRFLPVLKRALESNESSVPIENKVLTNLRGDLNRLDQPTKARLHFEFVVIHLCDDEEDVIHKKVKGDWTVLLEALGDNFPDSQIFEIGPKKMGVVDTPPEPRWIPLSLDVVQIEITGEDSRNEMYFGIGKLHELVVIYSERRDSLFEKNVRYFVNRKRNIEGEGPSSQMKKTLASICIDAKDDPAIFAFYHNGVTVYAKNVRRSPDGQIEVREPYVLNGCQTIKSAFDFYKSRTRVDEARWRSISIPVRIISTKDASLIRRVTANNNRQNAIRAVALWANEPEQLEIEERFRRSGIFYERQEGAFTDLKAWKPETLSELYPNTGNRCVKIEDLARSIAAVKGKTEWARSPSDIFESNDNYKQCFSPAKSLRSIVFLTFLQNTHDVIFAILQNGLNLEQSGAGPRPRRLGYYALCLLIRYLAKYEYTDFVTKWGGALWGNNAYFKGEIITMLGPYRSGIRKVLKDDFLTLEDGQEKSLRDAFKLAEAKLHLKDNIDPFDMFKGLDNEN